ncbi:hypothetical protein ABVV53_07265 [Novosphingobium sp. RD2P27]|uniref:Entry exclusion lipoprotein TrbK n=1 Tax=Novosphingobium kalidii TaxID=3230299 RepID=A0ABV2D0S8_9SPHN
MSGMLFALALFGCSDDGSACERLAAPEQTYESRVECMASQPKALDSRVASSADHPSVFAHCMTKTQLTQLGKNSVDLRKVGVAFAAAGY